jgi:hypothetical protein
LQLFKVPFRRTDEPETDLLCCPSTIQGNLALTGSHLSHRPFIYTTFNISCLKGSMRELEGLYITFKSYTKSSAVQLSVRGSVVSVSSDCIRSTWLASNLQQMPVGSKL